MPIHLPPINRRGFLAGTFAAGAGVLLGRFAQAEQRDVDANSFLLMADTHVGSRRDLVHGGIQPAKNLQQAIAETIARTLKPAGAIVAGDCSFRQGDAGDYVLLRELVRPLREAGSPIHLAMGNHDHRENLLAAFPEAHTAAEIAKQAPDKCISVLETPYANWFLLDSWQRPGVTPGTLGERQLAWLAKALDARRGKPAIVLAHHNPDVRQSIQGLTDTRAFLDVLMPRRHVKAYIHGHTHGWNLGQQAGFHVVNLPTLVWTFDKAQLRGYVGAQLHRSGVTLTLHSLDHKHPKHGQKIELAWRT
ncbi:MAG: metallophosphoesterase [Planctomycetaceae bacterium]|nr:metallophosphoesterase [Planctomycetaceae bacterium]